MNSLTSADEIIPLRISLFFGRTTFIYYYLQVYQKTIIDRRLNDKT